MIFFWFRKNFLNEKVFTFFQLTNFEYKHKTNFCSATFCRILFSPFYMICFLVRGEVYFSSYKKNAPSDKIALSAEFAYDYIP